MELRQEIASAESPQGEPISVCVGSSVTVEIQVNDGETVHYGIDLKSIVEAALSAHRAESANPHGPFSVLNPVAPQAFGLFANHDHAAELVRRTTNRMVQRALRRPGSVKGISRDLDVDRDVIVDSLIAEADEIRRAIALDIEGRNPTSTTAYEKAVAAADLDEAGIRGTEARHVIGSWFVNLLRPTDVETEEASL